MIETKGAPMRAKHAFIVSAREDLDVERICRECSEEACPPEVFLVNCKSIGNALLGVRLEYLEQGQLLLWPGLPLVGATFDLDWGFASAVIGLGRDGSTDFRSPEGLFDVAGDRDTFGYRLCPIDDHEIQEAIEQIAQIRAELAKPRQQHRKKLGIEVTVTQL